MRKILTVILVFALFALLPVGGFSLEKKKTEIERAQEFKEKIIVDKSCKEDVIEAMGKPNIKAIMDYSNFKLSGVPFVDEKKIMAQEIWTYVDPSKHKAWDKTNVVPTLGGVIFSHNIKVLTVYFDKKGKVLGYEMSEIIQ